jgi:DNA recombination protein RmuC
MIISVVAASVLAVIFALAFLGALFFWQRTRHERDEARVQSRLFEARLIERAAHEEALRAAARNEFENLASRIIERETKQFQETSEKGLERLLSPLKERLKDFEKRVEDSYQAEGRERHVLKVEVERLIQLNERMAQETNSLTLALKGDSKFQGDWGELVLENILESSGLREGIEYTKQQSLSSQDGDRFRPDVIVNLPDGKQIIIDSKVSLKSYELHCRTDHVTHPVDRERHLKAHIDSLMNHVNELSDKHYPKLKGLKTPEFVFLFTPIEPAYLLAMRHDPDLATRAWKKGVAIVTSTTLFTSLKTVASIWRLEHQNRNAQEIAEEAAKLYDKFVGFHDDFEKIGRIFENGTNQFEEARRKLRDGPGNVFRKIELLRELGAAPNKRLKPELLE